MAEVIFNYDGNKITIQYNSNEKLKDIIKRYIIKTDKKKDDIYFLYGGSQINEDLTFEEHASSEDKKRNKMSILVFDRIDNDESKSNKLKKSNNLICPECKENIRIYINNFKITLQNCKNNHKIENLLINEFEKSQNIDESQILCQKCKIDKSQVYNNKFYFCIDCQVNLCPLCILEHDKAHNIKGYDQKYFIDRKSVV